MKELQSSLMRASAVARLDEIVSELRQSGMPSDDENRKWLAELLFPLNEAATSGPCRLTPSPNVSTEEGSAILAVLMEQVRDTPDALERLEASVRDLSELRAALMSDAPMFSDDLSKKAIDVANRLRRHFIGVLTPVPPDADCLV